MACLALFSFLPVLVLLTLMQAQHLNAVKGEKILTFFALGDWGGLPFSAFNYSTTVERAVADGMGKLADVQEPSFVVALGDNFYFTGVDDVNDERFFDTFENIFTSPSLQIPWQVCAGNHDHYGNVSAQIAYTKKSIRWNFPYYYHSRTWAIPDSSTTIQLVLIDTVMLCGTSSSDESDEQPSGPKSKERADRQWLWLKNILGSSTADYLLVGGHFPVWSAGMHGPTDCLLNKLKPLLETYKVTAYLAGHDHNNQHIYDDRGVNYFVTGCATFVQDWPFHADDVPEGSLKLFWADRSKLGGYISFAATPSEMTATFMAATGDEVYSTIMKPRNNVLH